MLLEGNNVLNIAQFRKQSYYPHKVYMQNYILSAYIMQSKFFSRPLPGAGRELQTELNRMGQSVGKPRGYRGEWSP